MSESFIPDPPVIAALHLPPFPASAHPDARSITEIRDYALRNAEMAVKAGINGLYLQDLGDHPVARPIPPHVIAGVAVVGTAIRAEFPHLKLGVCLMGHGAKEPLAIAQAIDAHFVRLKVYVGTMVKAEGLLEGCASEAIQYRHQIGAEEIALFADVYDRTGEPLGRLPLVEECRQAAVFGRADAVVITGLSFQESLSMISEVRQAKMTVPLWIGGGVNAGNVEKALEVADGIIVSSAFKKIGGFTRESMRQDWDPESIKKFMEAVQKAQLSRK